MNHQETQDLAKEIKDEIERTPTLRSLVEVEPIQEVNGVWQVRFKILQTYNLPNWVTSRDEWEKLKAELLSRWPDGSR